ncbi:MAG: leucine-rich repeat protein [Ruminococcus sp.]|nr:leucine-rich repeat protein [Ruminococcus sp.]
MNCSFKKLLSLFFVIPLIICSLAGISVLSSNAHTTELSPVGITTYNLNVGDTKHIFLDESDKAIQSAVWTSNAPFDVEIISQDSVSCQIKANKYISTTAIITCEYYYQQFNSLTGQIWLIKGAKAFYVKVNEESQTVPPSTPTVPDTPNNPSKTYVYDRGTLGIYKYIIKTDGTAEITDYEYKLETSITVPSSINGYTVTSIGESAFEYCGKLKGITIPEGVTEIKNNAFYYCYAIESVTLPTTLVSIGDNAFLNCKSIESITFPETLTSIGEYAFCGCDGFKSVNIPANLTSIDFNAFASCDSLESIIVDEANIAYTSVDGVLFSKDMKTLVRYPNGKDDTNYSIPDSVNTIASNAFSSCAKLQAIELPQSIKSIGSAAFNLCTKLSQINIPKGITVIERSSFANCTALESISIPEGVKEIKSEAFYGCKALKSAYLPESAETISSMAFLECNKSTLTFYGYEGSESETFANKYGFGFIALAPPVYELGDANTDGNVNIKDATAIQKHLAGIEFLSNRGNSVADFNNDSNINIKDATAIQKFIAGIL